MNQKNNQLFFIRIFFIFWFPLISYLAFIFYLSHSPQPTGGYELPGSDKIWHAVQFFPLPLLFFRAFRSLMLGSVSKPPLLARRYFLFGLLFAIFYAISDEVHQFFIPERDASFLDLTADFLGIFIGAFIFRRNTYGIS